MSLISQAISQLINGVSQQAPALRLSSQAELQENCYSSPVDGLKKRAGTTHLARLMDAPDETPFVHTIHRDTREQYAVVLTDGDLKVFDLKTGQPQVVNFPEGKDYLRALNPRRTMRGLTVEDYTFILNKDIRPTIAPVPYFENDALSAAVSFGSGKLVEEGTHPQVPGGMYSFKFKVPSNSTPGTWLWWGPNTQFATVEQAYQEFDKFVQSQGSYSMTGYGAELSSYDHEPVIRKDIANMDNPRWDNTTGYSGDMRGIRIENKAPIFIKKGGANGGAAWDAELRIYFQIAPSTYDLNTLRPFVGWPLASSQDEYKVPGQKLFRYEAFDTDGDIFVQVNNRLFVREIDPTWDTPAYASWFASQIAAAFPDLEVTTSNYVLNIKAQPGSQLWVSSWSSPANLVNAVYQDLPTQEAVFVVIRQGVADQVYSVSINGTMVSFATGHTDAPETYRAETIARNLADQLNAANAGFQAASYGGFVRVIRPDNAKMTFAAHDTWGQQAMYAMKNRVNAFEDLPGSFIPGYPIEVSGVGASGYYVHWEQKDRQPTKSYGIDNQVARPFGLSLVKNPGNVWTANEGEDTGIWAECAKPGVASVLNPATMPHALIREKDGTFTFKSVNWEKRTCGDEASVPSPSLVGKPIVDMFFHRNRLGFLSEQSVVFSRSGEFFNLWPTTAKDVLDGDPIDTLVNHTRVSTLRHTAVFNNQLLIFSDNTQFVVSAQNLLTPKTVTIQPSTEFDCSALAKPVNAGQDVFFVAERGAYSQVREYFVLPNAMTNTSTDVTAHVPRYVPAKVHKLALCASEDLITVMTENQPNDVFIYKFMWDGDKKLQESWSVFTFGREVVNCDFIGNRGYFVFRSDGGLQLEVIDFESNFTDGPLGEVKLDRKVKLTGTVVGENTQFNLPWATTGLKAISLTTGEELPATYNGATATIAGKPGEVMFGTPYQMRYRFSPLYFRSQGNSITGSKLMVKTFEVQFTEAVKFDLQVHLTGRTYRSNPYVSRSVGNNILGSIKVTDGKHRVAVLGEGADVAMELVDTSHFPLTVLSATYEGQYNLRTRRV